MNRRIFIDTEAADYASVEFITHENKFYITFCNYKTEDFYTTYEVTKEKFEEELGLRLKMGNKYRFHELVSLQSYGMLDPANW